jgi:hypothetical protein
LKQLFSTETGEKKWGYPYTKFVYGKWADTVGEPLPLVFNDPNRGSVQECPDRML